MLSMNCCLTVAPTQMHEERNKSKFIDSDAVPRELVLRKPKGVDIRFAGHFCGVCSRDPRSVYYAVQLWLRGQPWSPAPACRSCEKRKRLWKRTEMDCQTVSYTIRAHKNERKPGKHSNTAVAPEEEAQLIGRRRSFASNEAEPQEFHLEAWTGKGGWLGEHCWAIMPMLKREWQKDKKTETWWEKEWKRSLSTRLAFFRPGTTRPRIESSAAPWVLISMVKPLSLSLILTKSKPLIECVSIIVCIPCSWKMQEARKTHHASAPTQPLLRQTLVSHVADESSVMPLPSDHLEAFWKLSQRLSQFLELWPMVSQWVSRRFAAGILHLHFQGHKYGKIILIEHSLVGG